MSVEKTVLDNKGGRARVHSRNSLPQAFFFLCPGMNSYQHGNIYSLGVSLH